MIAIIIAVVAVFDINIENNAVVKMIPSNRTVGRVPKGVMKARAKRTSKPCLLAAKARKKPPKNNTNTGLATGFKYVSQLPSLLLSAGCPSR